MYNTSDIVNLVKWGEFLAYIMEDNKNVKLAVKDQELWSSTMQKHNSISLVLQTVLYTFCDVLWLQ